MSHDTVLRIGLFFTWILAGCQQACGPQPLTDSEVSRLVANNRVALNALSDCLLNERGKAFALESPKASSSPCLALMREVGTKNAYSTDSGAVYVSVYSFGMAGTGIYQWVVRPSDSEHQDGGHPHSCREVNEEWCVLLTGR